MAASRNVGSFLRLKIQTKVTKYRQVHAHSFIMGNQGKMVGNSKICIGIQSQLNLPDCIWHFLFAKCNLWIQRNNKLNLKCIIDQDQFLENLNFPIHFLQFWYCRITENLWRNKRFLKPDNGLLCTPHLVYCFFKFVSYTFQRESVKYSQLPLRRTPLGPAVKCPS